MDFGQSYLGMNMLSTEMGKEVWVEVWGKPQFRFGHIKLEIYI